MLTLVRDTYRATDDIGELLSLRDAAGHPASSQDIADHLLDRVLPAAYTQQPGEPPPRYDLPAAERALQRIATRMNNDGTRDLQWWHAPAWAHAAPRFIATWLGAGLAAGLSAGLWVGLSAGLSAGLLFGIGAGIVAGVAFGRGNKIPRRMTPLRWRQLFRRRPLVVGLLAGTVGGFAFWWINHALTLPAVALLWDALVLGLVIGFVAWLGAGLVAGMSRPGTDNTSPLSPLSSWRSDRAFGLAAGLVAGLAFALSFGFVFGLNVFGLYISALPTVPGSAVHLSIFWPGLVYGFVAGLAAGLVFGLAYPQTWSSSLAFAQLAASDRTPVRLMRFLEDARSRSVLRTVGPVYQFRHARLQDRLAVQEPATGPEPGIPLPAAGNAAAPTAGAPPAGAI